MAVLKKTPIMLLFFILLGGLLGGVLSLILEKVSPTGMLHTLFAAAIPIGINPPLRIDLFLLSFTIGFSVNVNLLMILGILLGIYTYKTA